jgi:hypothetical protein
MTEWFKHDYKARTHPTLQRILMKWDWKGVGVYWAVIEMLYENDGVLKLSECDSYAFALRLDREWFTSFIQESKAFEFDGDFFYSETATERLKSRDELSEKRSLSARKRWSDANAMQTESKSNARREEKRREEEKREDIREERVSASVKRFTPPSVDEVLSIMGDKKQSEMFVAFYASKGWVVGKTQMKDWKSAVRGWMARNGMKPATNGQKLYGDSI